MDSSLNLHELSKEVLVSTDVYGQSWNICVFDHTTGTNLLTYKNCSTVSHGLGFIKDTYMLCSVYNKPYLVYWNLRSKNAQPAKINLPNFAHCLAVSYCGNYIAVGIEEKVFVLQTFSGKILNILTQHFQNIVSIKFSIDQNYLITASEDTSILVWSLNEVVKFENKSLKPVFTWNGHSMKITDIHVSATSDLVVSTSADLSCKLWNLNSDKSSHIMSVLFQDVPSKCMLNYSDNILYVGLSNGDIYEMSLSALTNEQNKLMNEENARTFLGHKQKITSLALTWDDTNLASGSDDNTIRIWNTLNRQCIKIINLTCGVTNLEFKSRNLFFNDDQNVEIPLASRFLNDKNIEDVVCLKSEKFHIRSKLEDFLKDGDDFSEEYLELKSKYENTSKLTNKIYNFALQKILN